MPLARSPPPNRRVTRARSRDVTRAPNTRPASRSPPLSTHSEAHSMDNSFVSVESERCPSRVSSAGTVRPDSPRSLDSADFGSLGGLGVYRPPAKTTSRPRNTPATGACKRKTPATPFPEPDFGDTLFTPLLQKLHGLMANIPSLLNKEKSVRKEDRELAVQCSVDAARLLQEVHLTYLDCLEEIPGLNKGPAPAAAPAPAAPTTTTTAATTTNSHCCEETLAAAVTKAVTQAVRTEFGRLKPALTAQPPASSTTKTYAQTLASTPAQPVAGATQPRLREERSTRPALIMASKDQKADRQAVTKTLRATIPFREVKFTAAKVEMLSRGKARVEFDSTDHLKEAMRRININTETSGVSAEPERKLMPMIALKGISKDTASKDLIATLKEQNPELGNDERIKLRFLRRNRNPNLYNAVLTVPPRVFHTILSLGRVRLDHQRVHAEEFSPFLQCRRCLQFGHTQTRCSAETPVCAHCATAGHLPSQCPNKALAPSCANCTTHNVRFKTDTSAKHAALDQTCPRQKAMRARVLAKVDYTL